ncbi:MAG: M1 family metallopeptidase [Blastococcus sp.]
MTATSWIARATTVLLAGAALVGLVAGPTLAAGGSAGANSAGDPYFPLQGNGGYDVGHYDLKLDYAPASGALRGVVTIRATATQQLTRFDLDLRRTMTVSSVTVDGRAARFSQPADLGQELVVTPSRDIRSGGAFTVVVTYSGVPGPVIDPDGSIEGWVHTGDGAFVVNEPQGSPSWYPCNDSPRDKASFDFSVSVPQGLTAVANGTLGGSSTAAGRTTFTWHQPDPMSTYLAFVTTGVFRLTQGTTPGGIPYLDAVDPSQAAQSQVQLAKLPAMLDFFTSIYGPYPWNSGGALIDDAPQVGYALETTTRPEFDQAPSELTLAHELAHQWLGDSVTLARWRDIWLNEGFAEWSSWYWSEHTGQTSAQQFFARKYATNAKDTGFWNPPPGDPGGPVDLFATSEYDRGAMTLQALRVEIGRDAAFLALLHDWHAAHRYGNARVEDFIAFTEGRFPQLTDLKNFFQVWLYEPGKPTAW